MQNFNFVPAATSRSLVIFIGDSTSLTGAGLTGLVFNSAGLTCYYAKAGAAPVAVTLATLAATTTAWSSGGFKELDATNMPGWYRFDPPDAVLSTTAEVGLHLQGAANMVPSRALLHSQNLPATLMVCQTGTITADAIASDSITAAKIATDAITAAKIADGAIDAATLATGTITSAKFAAGAVDAAAIAADAIGASELAADAATEIGAAALAAWNTQSLTKANGAPTDFRTLILGIAHALIRNRVKYADRIEFINANASVNMTATLTDRGGPEIVGTAS